MASYRNRNGVAVGLCRKEQHATGVVAPGLIGKAMLSAWHQDESFWGHSYPFMFSEDAFARASQQVEQALALANVEARRVLDLCCGPGRHTVPLAQKGFSVTAVDLSPFLLGRATEKTWSAL